MNPAIQNMNYPTQWTMLFHNKIDEENCRDFFFKRVDEHYRASENTIETIETYFLNKDISIFEIPESVLAYSIDNINLNNESSKADLNKVRTLHSAGTIEFRFPCIVEPIDLEEVIKHKADESVETWLQVDGVLVAFDNYRDYVVKTYGQEEAENEEVLETDSTTGCFTIIPLHKGASVLGSNHNWALTEDFKTDYDSDERETYGNLFDIVQFLYFEILNGNLSIKTSVDGFGNRIAIAQLPENK